MQWSWIVDLDLHPRQHLHVSRSGPVASKQDLKDDITEQLLVLILVPVEGDEGEFMRVGIGTILWNLEHKKLQYDQYHGQCKWETLKLD